MSKKGVPRHDSIQPTAAMIRRVLAAKSALGLTNADIAKTAGCGKTSIRSFLTGRHVSPAGIEALAKGVGLTYAELMGPDDSSEQAPAVVSSSNCPSAPSDGVSAVSFDQRSKSMPDPVTPLRADEQTGDHIQREILEAKLRIVQEQARHWEIRSRDLEKGSVFATAQFSAAERGETVILDFHNYPGLLVKISDRARKEFRTTEGQILHYANMAMVWDLDGRSSR